MQPVLAASSSKLTSHTHEHPVALVPPLVLHTELEGFPKSEHPESQSPADVPPHPDRYFPIGHTVVSHVEIGQLLEYPPFPVYHLFKPPMVAGPGYSV